MLCLFFAVNGYAQNVGVNKPSPNHPLDVGGNVNVDGNILLNGTAGAAGQVMRTNAAGGSEWANMGEYNYIRSFTQNSNFTVPTGVTKLMVEVWGAGGGGAEGGGGGGGTYLLSVQDVTPGEVIAMDIGFGGSGASSSTTSAGQGESTSVTFPSSNDILALGGNGATSSSPGTGRGFAVYFQLYDQHFGGSGGVNEITYQQKNSTTYTISTKYGSGGGVYPHYERRNEGSHYIRNESTNSLINADISTNEGTSGIGGSGGPPYRDGGRGKVVIRY